VLLPGKLQSEHFGAEESVKTTILLEPSHFMSIRPVLLSGNVQSEHVTAVESVQTTILSEP